jgi:hypothetical protein
MMTEPDIVILSSDRYHPWNGERLDQPDHIWADLPFVTGVELAVYCEGDQTWPVEYAFGRVSRVSPDRWSVGRRLRVAWLAIRAVYEGVVFDRRLLMGVTPSYFAWRLYRKLARRPPGFPVLRWQRAQVVLEEYLRARRPRAVVFHDEFGEWAIAVCNACRTVGGISPIAYQHAAVAHDSPQYAALEQLRGRIADGLLCISPEEAEKWSALPLPTLVVGSRRPRWDLGGQEDGGPSSVQGQQLLRESDQRILLVPGLADTRSWQEQIHTAPHLQFVVKPHPLRRDGWTGSNVEVTDERVAIALRRFDVVVTSSPNVQLTLGILGHPFVRVRGAYDAREVDHSGSDTDSDTDSDDAEEFGSLSEALAGVSDASGLAARRGSHVPSWRVPPDVTRESFLDAVVQLISA